MASVQPNAAAAVAADASAKTQVKTKGGYVVIYNGDNFPTWARTAEIALHVVRAWDIVEGTEPAPPANATSVLRKDYQERESAAIEILSTSLKPEFTAYIMTPLRANDPRSMWQELQQLNRNANVGHSGRLKDRFNSLAWDPSNKDKTLRQFATDLKDLQLQLVDTEHKVSDTEVVTRVILGLPREEFWLPAQSTAFAIRPFTLDRVLAELQGYELTWRANYQEKQQNGESANAATHRGRDSARGRGRVSLQKTSSTSTPRRKGCYYCGSEDHMQPQCKYYKAGSEKAHKKERRRKRKQVTYSDSSTDDDSSSSEEEEKRRSRKKKRKGTVAVAGMVSHKPLAASKKGDPIHERDDF
jgi:hypothetical protein